MADKSQKFDPEGWTGKPDPLAAKLVWLALGLGAIGFLIIGVLTLH